MSLELNQGVVTLNKTSAGPLQKTIVVIGMARSGTSMLAKILDGLGVFMGKKIDPTIIEDDEMRRALEEEPNLDMFRALVTDRNENHAMWGWKRPAASYYIPRFINEIRNPHFVIPFRDYIAIAERAKLAANHDVRQYIIGLHREQYKTIIDFISETKVPCCLVSYEKGISKKENLIRALADFIDVQLDDELLQSCMQLIEPDNKDYIEKTTLADHVSMNYSGCLGNPNGNILKGWLKRNNNNLHVDLQLFVNDEYVRDVRADQFRPDLKELGYGDGKYGFVINLDELGHQFPSSAPLKVSLRTKEESYEIPNSPIHYQK